MGRIAGRVIDAATEEPLPGVNIGLRGTTLGAATSQDGRFTIDGVPPDTYVLQASFIGHATIERTVTVKPGGTINMVTKKPLSSPR